ncbi:hypothetical protein GUG52_31300, partial [Xanthomonas citri pv. citri]|nr:hypothetical protein [Xanthomonas citri pv. citri]
EQINDFIVQNKDKLLYQDQDVFNKLLDGMILKGDNEYNYALCMLVFPFNGILHHYIGPIKPWDTDFSRPAIAKGFYETIEKI